jgi:hypothetical protein
MPHWLEVLFVVVHVLARDRLGRRHDRADLHRSPGDPDAHRGAAPDRDADARPPLAPDRLERTRRARRDGHPTRLARVARLRRRGEGRFGVKVGIFCALLIFAYLHDFVLARGLAGEIREGREQVSRRPLVLVGWTSFTLTLALPILGVVLAEAV